MEFSNKMGEVHPFFEEKEGGEKERKKKKREKEEGKCVSFFFLSFFFRSNFLSFSRSFFLSFVFSLPFDTMAFTLLNAALQCAAELKRDADKYGWQQPKQTISNLQLLSKEGPKASTKIKVEVINLTQGSLDVFFAAIPDADKFDISIHDGMPKREPDDYDNNPPVLVFVTFSLDDNWENALLEFFVQFLNINQYDKLPNKEDRVFKSVLIIERLGSGNHNLKETQYNVGFSAIFQIDASMNESATTPLSTPNNRSVQQKLSEFFLNWKNSKKQHQETIGSMRQKVVAAESRMLLSGEEITTPVVSSSKFLSSEFSSDLAKKKDEVTVATISPRPRARLSKISSEVVEKEVPTLLSRPRPESSKSVSSPSFSSPTISPPVSDSKILVDVYAFAFDTFDLSAFENLLPSQKEFDFKLISNNRVQRPMAIPVIVNHAPTDRWFETVESTLKALGLQLNRSPLVINLKPGQVSKSVTAKSYILDIFQFEVDAKTVEFKKNSEYNKTEFSRLAAVLEKEWTDPRGFREWNANYETMKKELKLSVSTSIVGPSVSTTKTHEDPNDTYSFHRKFYLNKMKGGDMPSLALNEAIWPGVTHPKDIKTDGSLEINPTLKGVMRSALRVDNEDEVMIPDEISEKTLKNWKAAGILPILLTRGKWKVLVGIESRSGEGKVLNFIGGGKNTGEVPWTTALREYAEETGLSKRNYKADSGLIQNHKRAAVYLKLGSYVLFISVITETDATTMENLLKIPLNYNFLVTSGQIHPPNNGHEMYSLHWLNLEDLLNSTPVIIDTNSSKTPWSEFVSKVIKAETLSNTIAQLLMPKVKK
jgi:8-oxo-dGTP pyrophosphatase MutT (NUDIX family)